jgi:hypothetical protein
MTFVLRRVAEPREADLAQVAGALHSNRLLARLLERGHQDGDEDRDDPDDDQQLDERETLCFSM